MVLSNHGDGVANWGGKRSLFLWVGRSVRGNVIILCT